MSEPDERTDSLPPARQLVSSAVRAVLGRVGAAADTVDSLERVPPAGTEDGGVGIAASAWALARTAGVLASAPVSAPTLAVAARRTAALSRERTAAFGDHLRAVMAGAPSPLPARSTKRIDGRQRWLITSDLHRCIPGRVDWPRRQRTKDLYARMLGRYADRGWGLIENGDVEDFWMVGGTTWGAFYDIARMAGSVASPLDRTLEVELLGEQLDRIVDNNALIYRTIRDRFAAEGRYHRTVGNHDEALADDEVARRLGAHLPGVEPVDSLVLVDPGVGRDADSVSDAADVMAVVAHGHLTDSWNGPGFSALGRAITWLGLGLEELPTPGAGEGLADEEAVERLLDGRGRNRLVSLDPRFGGNRRFDSLDEELLFAALAADAPADGWPWLLFGHTHYPMLRPVDEHGEPTLYANSGTGVLDAAVSAIEWEPSRADPVGLVIWREDGDGLCRYEMEADGNTLAVARVADIPT
ncbi:MAG: hypothetical protein GY812_07415 [Actinomycetia bacterium]|nr:hypothetical protein [Actinomycetes bacterium]